MMNKRRYHYHINKMAVKSLAILSAVLLMLPIAGCSLIPSDITVTIPGMVTEITTSPLDQEIISSSLAITEIMTTNSSTLQTADQGTPDWIEIYNSSLSDIDLTGFSLSDNLKNPDKWVFSGVTIKAGGYLLVYASGESATEVSEKAGEIHAAFRLNAEGDELIMTSPTGQVLARLTIPALPSDISYGLSPSASTASDPYYFFGAPTPGQQNGTDGKQSAAEAIPNPKYTLLLNEYMTVNKSFPDSDGDLPDWIELINTGAEPIALLGFQLSDSASQPDKWVFPDVTVAPGGILVVWLSGNSKVYDPADPTSLQASFKLSESDTELLLSDSRGLSVIRQDLEALPDNVSKGRQPDAADSWLYYPQATPGEPNTTAGFAEISGAISLSVRGVWINEVVAEASVLSGTTRTSQNDWIELYNGSGSAVSLLGYGLSDSAATPFRMTLGDVTLAPGEYLVIEPTEFGVSTADETIYLTAPDHVLKDWFDTGFLSNGISSGRGNTAGSEPADTRFFYAVPTRGQANSTTGSQTTALQPKISVSQSADGSPVNGLYLDGPALVSLSSAQPDAVIRYTLNGSKPDSNSPVYAAPLTVSANTVVRCRAELAGSLPSSDVSRTLLTDPRHDLPVVSIAVKADDMFGANGVWTNFMSRSIEAAAEVSFYENDGTFGIEFSTGIALHGSYSRKELQKSLEFNLRECYGDTQIIYPFFPDNEISTFKHLVLRTSSQDWKNTKLRDALMTEIVEDDLNVDTMDWRPCVVYINGEYFGLYEIRENVDQYYMASHYGVDPDNLDIIKGNAIVLEGSKDEYANNLTKYVQAHDMNDPAAYQHVLSLIDEQSLMDWLIGESFFSNLDSGNKKFWRERTEGAQWRWVLFDLDWAMSPATYAINTLRDDLLDPLGHGSDNIFNSVLQVKLMQNPEFRDMFIERYAGFLNTTFKTDRMLGILDSMAEQIRSEMPRQIARWGLPVKVSYWENNIAALRRMIGAKRGMMQTHLQQTFGLSTARMAELFPGEY